MTDISSAGLTRQQLIQQALTQVGKSKAPVKAKGPEGVKAPKAFQDAELVKGRAAFTQSVDTPENQRNLTRFQRIMDSGEELAQNAPRGTYLNIRI